MVVAARRRRGGQKERGTLRDVFCILMGMAFCRILFPATTSTSSSLSHTLVDFVGSESLVTNTVEENKEQQLPIVDANEKVAKKDDAVEEKNTIEEKKNEEPKKPLEKTPEEQAKKSKKKKPTCSSKEIDTLRAHPALADWATFSRISRCPITSYLDRMFETDSPSAGGYLAMTVGCNKAVDAIGTARSLSHNKAFDKNSWVDKVEKIAKKQVIQVCSKYTWDDDNKKNKTREQRVDYSQIKIGAGEKPVPLEYYCIEPLPATYKALKKSVEELGLDEQGFHVHQYVISEDSGTIPFPSRAGFGKESDSALKCGTENITCEDTPKSSLDNFVNKQKIDLRNRQLDTLFIDTEGFDLFVLRGARKVLEKTRYVEFEYHSVWPAEATLKEAVEYMDELDFTCYFQGREQLFRLTGCFGESFYQFKKWSNVACVKRSETTWFGIMEGLFKETMAAKS